MFCRFFTQSPRRYDVVGEVGGPGTFWAGVRYPLGTYRFLWTAKLAARKHVFFNPRRAAYVRPHQPGQDACKAIEAEREAQKERQAMKTRDDVVVTVPSVSYDGQIASLRLEQARLRIAELEVTAAAWQNAADLLEEPVNGDLEKFKSQLRRLQQQARAALVARDEYRGRFLKARMDLRKLRDQVEVRQEAGEATEPTKDLQRHLDAAEISLHVVQADLDDTICDLNATRQKYEKLEAEHRELQRHLDAAEISLHVVQADLDATVCDLNATRQKYEKLEAEHRELQEQHATLSAAVKVDPAALEEARAAVPLLEADRVLRTAADVLFWRCRRLSGVERSLCEAMHLSLVGLLLHVIKSKPTAYPLEAAPDN